MTRTTERATLRPPGPAYWLIAKNQNGRAGVLIIERDGGQQVLPIFSFEEEAEMFLRLLSRGVDEDWGVKESGVEELVSVLSGPCGGVKEVALDPLPEMVAERTVGLVSLLRERFIEYITARRRRSLGLCEPAQRSSLREGGRSRRSEADRIAAPEVMMHSKEEGMAVKGSSSCPFSMGNLGGDTLPNTPQGASQSRGTSYSIGFPRRNHRC